MQEGEGEMQRCYLGIDVGGTKIQGASSSGGEVALTAQLATPTADYASFVAVLVRVVEETRARWGELAGLAIGLPGTVGEQCVTWVPNLPFLNGKDLAGDLAARLGLAVDLANDAQLGLLGEVWRGAARGCRSAILVSLGTGVGGAIMVGGNIVRGIHGGAGAFGWLNLDWREEPDVEHGYVERHASGSALNELARQLEPGLTSRELIARARTHHAQSSELVERFSALLGAACASLASILDPEVLILAGGLSEAFDLFAPLLHQQMHRHGAPGVRHTPIVPARLGKNAAAYGALRAAMPPRVFWV
ncbi:MAG TPA: ROK family protein [Ktedonobacteraceae bacterium]|nr:ROK family protein [Ktedonobacteraceae bacterium]